MANIKEMLYDYILSEYDRPACASVVCIVSLGWQHGLRYQHAKGHPLDFLEFIFSSVPYYLATGQLRRKIVWQELAINRRTTRKSYQMLG